MTSPIVVVKKKDGDIRIYIDYRKLNALTKRDAYPMPRIDDILDELGQAKYITTLDLAKGYWQVLGNLQDQEKTAFSSLLGLFQFKRMPFGLSGAPCTFQSLMDRVINGLSFFQDLSGSLSHLEFNLAGTSIPCRTDISMIDESRINYQAKKKPINYGRVHLPWICDWKNNHKTGTEQIKSCRDVPSTNYQEGCSIILRIDGLLQEIYS